MAFKMWNVGVADKDAAKELALACDADPMVALIAMSRGIDTPEKLDEFLSDDVIMPDPFSMAGMFEAANRIRAALRNGEKITVFGDYDCDGVTATAILYRYLRSKGANVNYYIPAREGEGYGMSASSVEAIAQNGTKLIITVDNGIRAAREIELASRLGVDTVVTDHHIPAEEIPTAVAVIDPHLPYCPSGLRELSGAGVALMLISAVEDVTAEEMLEQYSALAALGTVADVVPLLGANRVIVRQGLAAINEGREEAFNQLLSAAQAKLPVNAENIAFILAPRINAAGRMDDASKALRLLIGDDEAEKEQFAKNLCELNSLRRNTEQEILTEAVRECEENGYCFDRIVVVSGQGWHCGVVGIVASCIAERYGRPAIVLSEENGVCTGSGRSVEGFDLIEALTCCDDLFEKYGGHSGAAGLTIKQENLAEFRQRINEYARSLNMPVPRLNIDCKLNPAAVNVTLASRLGQLEPFGACNPVPLFGLYGMKILKIDFVGDGKHTRLTVSKNETVLSCMLFSVGRDDLSFEIGDEVDLAVNLSVSYFKGMESVSVSVRGIRYAGCDGKVLAEGMRAYEDYKNGLLSGGRMAEIIPQREEIGDIWRLIKSRIGINRERLLFVSRFSPSKTALALDVLSELNLISETNGKYYINPSVKADLGNSRILKSAQVMV